jgi:hypothetical protein
MIVKTDLEKKAGRKPELPPKSGSGARYLVFSKLSGHEASLGRPHSKAGDFCAFLVDETEEPSATPLGADLSFETAFLLHEAEGRPEAPFLPLSVSYEVEYANGGADALISAFLAIFSPRRATICAALKVDDYELLPSARIPLEAGVNEARLRAVKLVRPEKYWGRIGRRQTPYAMELILWHGDSEPVLDARELLLWGP